jgi:hypothetical protein
MTDRTIEADLIEAKAGSFGNADRKVSAFLKNHAERGITPWQPLRRDVWQYAEDPVRRQNAAQWVADGSPGLAPDRSILEMFCGIGVRNRPVRLETPCQPSGD